MGTNRELSVILGGQLIEIPTYAYEDDLYFALLKHLTSVTNRIMNVQQKIALKGVKKMLWCST